MPDETKESCGCGCGGDGAAPTLTSEQHQQLLKGVLQACADNVDHWVEKAKQVNPDADDAEAVKMAHQHICSLLSAATQQPGQSASASPLGNSQQCLLQYQACLAAGNPPDTCLTQYNYCLTH